ncbi:hypothetical protein Tco_0114859 [Tanacetum coccineum]
MAQLKKLTFEELKVEFEKLMRSIESFVPMGSEERVKRAGVQLEQESSKKQKIVVEDVPVTEEKVEVVKKEEPIKRTGKRKKQKARKGTHADKTAKHEAEEDMEALVKGNDTNSSSAMLKSISKDDLTELYSINPVWNLPYQQKMLRWRYYDTCRVRCLTLESVDIYMLTERRYPIPADVCQAMLDKKLQGDKKDEACYQLHQELTSPKKMALLATPEQKATGKEISNPLIADSLLKTIRGDDLLLTRIESQRKLKMTKNTKEFKIIKEQAEEGPTNFALMAYSSTSYNSEVSTDSNCSSSCLENVKPTERVGNDSLVRACISASSLEAVHDVVNIIKIVPRQHLMRVVPHGTTSGGVNIFKVMRIVEILGIDGILYKLTTKSLDLENTKECLKLRTITSLNIEELRTSLVDPGGCSKPGEEKIDIDLNVAEITKDRIW